jgi:hypothetical protein
MSAREETSIRLSGNFEQSTYGVLLRHALHRALALDTKLPEWVVKMDGMSGKKYRYMVNNLVESLPNTRYLEVGSWAGSTACSAIYGNKVEKIRCIDNWSEFGGPKDRFMAHIDQAMSPDISFGFIESDFRQVNYKDLGKFNLYLFDGPHSEQDQFDGVAIAQPALDDHYILIVDDYNWKDVRDGTLRALKHFGATIECAIEIRTTQDDAHPIKSIRQESEWHNGYFFAVCKKLGAQ